MLRAIVFQVFRVFFQNFCFYVLQVFNCRQSELLQYFEMNVYAIMPHAAGREHSPLREGSLISSLIRLDLT